MSYKRIEPALEHKVTTARITHSVFHISHVNSTSTQTLRLLQNLKQYFVHLKELK